MAFRAGAEDDGMHPDFFGRPWWFVMHVTAENFPLGDSPEEQNRKRQTKVLFESMLLTLPCRTCRMNAQDLLPLLDRDFLTMTRRECQLLVFRLHNRVNKKLKKPVLPDSEFEKVVSLYSVGRVGKLVNGEDWTERCGGTQIIVKPRQRIRQGLLVDAKCIPTVQHTPATLGSTLGPRPPSQHGAQ